MFILQESPVNLTQARNSHDSPNNGALVNFEGMVRADDIKGSQTAALFYFADEAACRQEGKKIIQEALTQFSITEAVCIQRIGKVEVGETAVWIGVWSGHRDEAFKACRYIIEEVKKRLHIWKKELLADGTAAWVRGKETPVVT